MYRAEKRHGTWRSGLCPDHRGAMFFRPVHLGNPPGTGRTFDDVAC